MGGDKDQVLMFSKAGKAYRTPANSILDVAKVFLRENEELLTLIAETDKKIVFLKSLPEKLNKSEYDIKYIDATKLEIMNAIEDIQKAFGQLQFAQILKTENSQVQAVDTKDLPEILMTDRFTEVLIHTTQDVLRQSFQALKSEVETGAKKATAALGGSDNNPPTPSPSPSRA